MVNANDVRNAHKLLDSLFDNSELSHAQIDLIRDLMPELPKQKTLAEITRDVYDAWGGSDGNDWSDYVFGELETWLDELHTQLKGLETTTPAHPEFLETEADYQNAPEGTIVAKDSSGSVCVKTCLWPDMMVLTVKRRVLRWGWGDK